jgi:hypothetical protein
LLWRYFESSRGKVVIIYPIFGCVVLGLMVYTVIVRGQREKARASVEALRAKAELDRDRIKRLEAANKELHGELEADETLVNAMSDDGLGTALERLWLHPDSTRMPG